MINNNIIVLFFNFILYLSLFVFFQIKQKSIQVGSVVLFIYAFVSLGSIYLYGYSETKFDLNYWNIYYLPFIYLFCILFISFIPILHFSNQKVVGMIMPPSSLMRFISITIIVIYTLHLLITIIPKFSITDLLINTTVLVDNYEGQVETSLSGLSWIIAVLKNIFGDILWVMLMYNLINRNKILSIGILFSLVVSLLGALSSGTRGSMIAFFFQIPFAYIVFKPLMTVSQRNKMIMYAFVFLGFLLIGFGSLTYGRHGDNQYHSLTDYLVYYMSSDFLMFNHDALDPGGCRYGDRVFPLLRQFLGLGTAGGFRARRLQFPNLKLDDSQFSFFVGEFCIDFGPIIAFLIISFFSYIVYRQLKKSKYDLGDILIALLWYNILINGLFLFFYAEILGNLKILYLLFFVFLFKKYAPSIKQSSV